MENNRKEVNQKISEGLKKYYAEHGHHHLGRKGKPCSDEMKEIISKGVKAHWDKVGRKTEAQKKARNKANVYAYRARKRNAIPPDADLKLIRSIYENCPDGYHVDHIIALAAGGPHHQDNLQYLDSSENCRKGTRTEYDKTKALDWKEFIPR